MSQVCIVGGHAGSLVSFRRELIRVLVLSGRHVIAMAAPAEKSIIQEIESLGATFRPFKLRRSGLNPLEDIRTYLSLRKAFREIRPDLTLAYTIKPVIWTGLAMRKLKGPRFYALITGLGYTFSGTGLFRRTLTSLISCLYRLSLRRSSGVIFQNPDDMNIFIRRKIADPSRSYLVNGSGVDTKQFSEVPLPDGGVVFLAIARLLADKGLREYAKAAGIVKSRYPWVTFRLIGPADPSMNSISIAEVKSWESAGFVTYLGPLDDVRPALRDCHVYVLPSYHEGLPRTVLEAMSIGRPILTTDVPGCRETVQSGENGFLVPKGDAEALAERMIWFIENPSQMKRMGRRSRELVERFDVHKVNKEMMTIMGLI